MILPALQTFVERNGWRAGCSLLGLVALVVLVPLNLLLRRRPEELGLAPDGDPDTPASAKARRVNVVDSAWAAIDWTLARAMRTARFWWIAVAYFAALFSWYAVQVHQPSTSPKLDSAPGRRMGPRCRQPCRRAGADRAWLALGPYRTRDCVGDRQCGVLRHLYRAARIAIVSGHPTAVHDGDRARRAGVRAHVSHRRHPCEIFEGKHYGPIFGTLMLSALAGGAAGPWFMGFMHDRTGTYTVAFWVAIGCSVLSALAIWRAAPSGIRVVAGRMRAAHE